MLPAKSTTVQCSTTPLGDHATPVVDACTVCVTTQFSQTLLRAGCFLLASSHVAHAATLRSHHRMTRAPRCQRHVRRCLLVNLS